MMEIDEAVAVLEETLQGDLERGRLHLPHRRCRTPRDRYALVRSVRRNRSNRAHDVRPLREENRREEGREQWDCEQEKPMAQWP